MDAIKSKRMGFNSQCTIVSTPTPNAIPIIICEEKPSINIPKVVPAAGGCSVFVTAIRNIEQPTATA